jgi:hypothetical protein
MIVILCNLLKLSSKMRVQQDDKGFGHFKSLLAKARIPRTRYYPTCETFRSGLFPRRDLGISKLTTTCVKIRMFNVHEKVN